MKEEIRKRHINGKNKIRLKDFKVLFCHHAKAMKKKGGFVKKMEKNYNEDVILSLSLTTKHKHNTQECFGVG